MLRPGQWNLFALLHFAWIERSNLIPQLISVNLSKKGTELIFKHLLRAVSTLFSTATFLQCSSQQNLQSIVTYVNLSAGKELDAYKYPRTSKPSQMLSDTERLQWYTVKIELRRPAQGGTGTLHFKWKFQLINPHQNINILNKAWAISSSTGAYHFCFTVIINSIQVILQRFRRQVHVLDLFYKFGLFHMLTVI